MHMMLQMVWISEEMHNQNKGIDVIPIVCIVYVECRVFMIQSGLFKRKMHLQIF